MKPSLANRKPLSHARARNAALLNQLATPGLGSIVCGRWIAGLGQLILSVLGCVMIIVWVVRQISIEINIVGSMSDSAAPASLNPKLLIYGSIIFVISWVWSGVTSLSLMRQASDKGADALKNFGAPPPLKMDPAKIVIALGSIPDWTRNGEVISRTYQFKDFPAAIKFVNAVADAAEHAWHHPDIDIRWNKVTLALTTHSSGGLTEKDFALARKADELARG